MIAVSGVLTAGRTLWLAPILVFAGASSPSIAQRVPRFLFPALAVVGAALLLLSLTTSLVRFARRYGTEGRVRLVPVIVNAAATALFVVAAGKPELRSLDDLKGKTVGEVQRLIRERIG